MKEYNKKYINGERREELLNISRQYYLNNKQRQDELHKEYLLKNKDAINAKRTEIIQCVCGSSYQRAETSRHCKSKKHLEQLKKLNEEIK